MTAVAEQTGTWLSSFTAQPAAEPWIQALRDTAFAKFAALGFPTTKNEEWRFTNVAPIARTAWVNAASTANAPACAAAHLGKYAALDNPFVALNTAFLGDVRVIEVPRNTVLEAPIEIIYDAPAEGQAHHPRTLILVGANAHCTIVETYRGTGTYFTNAVTEVVVGDSAVVDHYKVQQESSSAFHVATMQVTIARSANFSSHSISLGGALVRNDANAVLSEGSHATLNGLYIVNGTQHIDNHTIIDHAKPHATSHEVYKGILDGKSYAVFTGKSSSVKTPRRPIPSRPTKTWSSPMRPPSTPSPSYKSGRTTCAARTAPPSDSSIAKCSSTCSRAASARSTPATCSSTPSPRTLSIASKCRF